MFTPKTDLNILYIWVIHVFILDNPQTIPSARENA